MSGPPLDKTKIELSDVDVCRVCLAGNTKLTSLKNKLLINLYEKLSETQFNSKDARSRALCCLCYKKLLKCHTFTQMALRSENIFTRLFQKNLEATYENITELKHGMEQLIIIDTIKESSYVTCADQPISVKEEMNTEEDPLQIDTSSQEDTKNNLTLQDSDIGTDIEELPPNRHVEQSQQEMSFICTTCSKEFIHKKTLLKHVSKSHSLLKKKYTCICNKKFNQISDVEKHMRIHTEEKPFTCDVCNNTFRLKRFLVCHMRSHSEQKSFVCNECDKHFNQKYSLVVHMLTHTNEKPFACNLCDKKFNYRPNLVRHQIIHTGQKPFACNACPKQFIQKSDVVRHMKVHIRKQPFACPICGKEYSRKKSFVSHMRTHTDTVGYNSSTHDVCNKKISKRKSTLGVHMRTRTDAKPFACDLCDMKFCISSRLKNHRRIHTGEKPFACDMCNKKFSIKATLVCHMRTHTGEKPFACDVCSKRFSDRTNLLKHKRIHTGEKPYACFECDKKFNHQSDLVRHTKTHSNAKPFACNMCDKKFKQNSTLVKHRKTHAAVPN